MTKEDLMSNWNGIVTDERLSLEKVQEHLDNLAGDAYLLDTFHAIASSGSSGRRGVFVYDWEGWLIYGLATFRNTVRWATTHRGVGPVVVAVVAAERANHVGSALVQTFSNRALPFHRVPVTLPVDEIVARLNEIQPTSLAGYPSMLHVLAEEARAGELRIRPERVGSSAEPLLPEARHAIEEAWGVPVFNSYAASESVIAAGCDSSGCHIADDLIFLEPVDSSGNPVPVGATSEKVYLTNLYNLALPLIRYEVTDEVTLLEGQCACGWSHRRIDDVHGRLDDVFSYGGVKVHPHVFRSPLARHREITAYRVRQTERGATIEAQLAGNLRVDDLRQEIEGALRKVGIVNAEVAITPVDSLDRGTTGKLKRFVPIGSPARIG